MLTRCFLLTVLTKNALNNITKKYIPDIGISVSVEVSFEFNFDNLNLQSLDFADYLTNCSFFQFEHFQNFIDIDTFGTTC